MSQIMENPRGGCVLAGINSVLGAINRVCPVLHSGPGCCMQTTAAEQGQSGHKSSCFVSGVSLPSSNMLEKEVVFGGTEKLRTTIQGAVDIIDADAYFVLTGCTAGIIGDDIASVTQEFQDSGHAVYPIETPGFAGDSNLGYEIVLFIGATDTTKFVREVAKALDLDSELVESVIQSEEQYVYNYLAQAVGVVSWKRFAVVADASNAVGITRYLANDFSFTPVLVVISEPIFRPEDKERIIEQINDMEYAVPPRVVFAADQYEINQALLNEEKEITLLIGSSNDREVALEKDIQFILASFPMSERLIFNRTYAGYRGSLTFTEDLYDNL